MSPSSSGAVSARPSPLPSTVAVVEDWQQRFGRGSVQTLVQGWLGPGATPENAEVVSPPVDSEPRVIERLHVARWGMRALNSEKQDECERDEARQDDGKLLDYLVRWEQRIRRLGRRYPERFGAPGLSFDEVCDALTVRLLEALRSPEHDSEFTRPAKPWALCVVTSELRCLRVRFRLKADVADLREHAVPDGRPSAEDSWLDAEARRCELAAVAAAEAHLSKSERQWYAALRLAARQGGFFQSSDQPNLSVASRLLGKDRSSAQRAYREITACFRAQLRVRR